MKTGLVEAPGEEAYHWKLYTWKSVVAQGAGLPQAGLEQVVYPVLTKHVTLGKSLNFSISPSKLSCLSSSWTFSFLQRALVAWPLSARAHNNTDYFPKQRSLSLTAVINSYETQSARLSCSVLPKPTGAYSLKSRDRHRGARCIWRARSQSCRSSNLRANTSRHGPSPLQWLCARGEGFTSMGIFTEQGLEWLMSWLAFYLLI